MAALFRLQDRRPLDHSTTPTPSSPRIPPRSSTSPAPSNVSAIDSLDCVRLANKLQVLALLKPLALLELEKRVDALLAEVS